jgi:hypothetical protein
LGVYIGGIAKTSQIKNVYRQMIARRRTTCPDC